MWFKNSEKFNLKFDNETLIDEVCLHIVCILRDQIEQKIDPQLIVDRKLGILEPKILVLKNPISGALIATEGHLQTLLI